MLLPAVENISSEDEIIVEDLAALASKMHLSSIICPEYRDAHTEKFTEDILVLGQVGKGLVEYSSDNESS